MKKFYSIKHRDIPGKDLSYNAKELAQTFRLVKSLIQTHFELSANRIKSIKTLERLIESFDKQLKNQGFETTSNKEHRTKLSDNIMEDDSVHWVFSELEENLLIKDLEENIPSTSNGLHLENPLSGSRSDFDFLTEEEFNTLINQSDNLDPDLL